MAKSKVKDKRRTTRVSWFRSLQTKILITLLIVTTLILAGFAVVNVTQARARLDSDLQRLAETTVQRLSQHLIGPLWALNDQQIIESIEATMLERRVYAVIIRAEDRESIYIGRERGPSLEIRDTKGNLRGDFIVSKTTLLHDNEEMIGVLEVYVTRRFLEQQFEDLVMSEIQRAGALDLALIIVTLILLRRVVVTPIRRLTEASEQIAAGQLSTKIEVYSRDEIGMLSGAINKLQTSLRIAVERMKRAANQQKPPR